MKLFSSLILSLCSVIGFSQTILYQAETTSRTVQDPHMIVLAQGFKAQSGASNSFVAKIGPSTDNPGGGPVDSNAGANNPIGTPPSQVFHDTKGNLDVNGAGQLQFTLPIALPPGVKSVAPQVSLTYVSGSGNGIAGYGWNISGITSISRTGRNVEKDGDAKKAQINDSDYYSFNSQRLILKSGEYGKDGAQYYTEKYSNVKIQSIGNTRGISGPDYWEVTFEDGSQAKYEKTFSDNFRGKDGTTPALDYNITKWKDAQGNYITYNYVYDNIIPETGTWGFIAPRGGVPRISNIAWGGNEILNKSHFNLIEFTYNDRDLIELSYLQGLEYSQSNLLSEIKVRSNGNLLKRYAVNYLKNGTNYQFLDKITEYNTEGQPANPVVFSYPNFVGPQIDYYGVLPYNNDNFNNIKFTGDFNGDSYLDFVMNNGTVKLGAFNDAYSDIVTGKTFNSDAKVVNTLIDEEGQVHNGNGIVQYEDGKVVGYIFRDNTFVKVFQKTISPTSCTICVSTLDEGDINGDGISDIFLTLKSGGSGNGFIDKLIIDLKNPNNTVSNYSQEWGIDESLYTDQRYLDIDRDGKVDIINVSNSAYTVFEFIKTAPNQYLKKIKFSGSLKETKASETPIMFGDFNGDGNLDFTIPTTDTQNADNWRFYMGTEKGFENVLKTNFLKYRKPSNPNTWSLMDHHYYSISDINKDGKSDITFIYSKNTIGYVNGEGNAQWRVLQYEVKTMQANGGTNFILGLNTTSPAYNIPGGDYELFQPLSIPIKSNSSYYDIFLFKNTRVHKYKSQSSLAELSRIQSITQGDITTHIDYLEIIPDNTINPNFYKKTKKEYYPYFSLNRADQSFAVSQLRQEGKKQDFRYRNMIGHMQGKGVIGYHQTARSSWYADGFENTKIWSGVEIDPLNDGVPVKEWSIRTTDEAKIFPTDLSENNTQLLSFKSIQYQTDRLLNGQIVNSITDSNKPNIVTALLPKRTKSKDFLTGIIAESNITYGDYYLPLQSTSNVNNGYGITTSTFDYTHNPSGTGADYYIGRPKSKTDVVKAYGDTKSAKEEYLYETNLLKTQKIWNRDNSGYVLETYSYDGFGNIIQKEISNSIDSQIQTVKTVYDPKGKFVLKKTDNLGLNTLIEYNDWGQIKKQTDPLGNTLENTYDNWGKLSKAKTNLEGTTTYQYEKDNNSNRIVTGYEPDGNIAKKYINRLGLEYKISSKAFGQGQYISKETQYDILGRKIKESEPYFEGQSANRWNTIAYNDSVFPAKITVNAFNGKQMETSVSGLVTTMKELNGYGRTTIKTTDALGNTISTTDKGGIIQFSYNAAAEQIKAQYAENIVTTQYDAWGRKSEFNDPSNGVYKYEYDGFGQPKKTISPKGTKEYTYNNLGQLISQKELSAADGGQTTNKMIAFAYDDKGRLVSKSGTSKGNSYTSHVAYDPQGRLLSSSENGNGKYFIQKGITYDDKARVVSYEKQLYSSGVLTKVQIENLYSTWNGELYQIKDKNSGKILWQLNETNAKGQVLATKLGAVNINNTYDNNGFLTNINHSSAIKPSVLQVSYSFDAIKNELKSRTTGGDFNITESFDYDDNNRLVNWTHPVTGVKPSTIRNVYDIKGRILENDQLGKIKFNNPTKIYQATGMTLNTTGEQNYKNDLIQTISYNENNDPVFIDGEKGDVAFQYGLTAMRQKVSYSGNFGNDQEGKLTKYYSESGSFEVVKDNVTGKEKHILYIGGTPYESNIVYLKNFNENSGSYKFLHKDYIGSLLAISDEAGNKLEQRHFDAWGNFTHLQIGNGPVETNVDKIKEIVNTGSLLLERGYTSHEHFMEVGIIHMNGRLYDPLLRRFLNADENIQDPYNTQIYNKYGYAVNNPLMYNDPTGEVLPFLIGIGLGYLGATLLSGAIIGAVISIGIYTLQATINNNWSLGGFAKALLMGAVTGAISAGAGEIFSAGGFLATVGNGAIAGGGAGGVTALINGDNFLKGLATGAVIGGGVAAISYTINFYSRPRYSELTKTEYDSHGISNSGQALEPSIDTLREMYKDTGWSEMNTGAKQFYVDNPTGKYIRKGDLYYNTKTGEDVIAYTRRNFWDGDTSSINFSKGAFASKIKLGFTMMHELGHSIINLSPSLNNFLQFKTKNGYEPELLYPGAQGDFGKITIEHAAIWGIEKDFLKLNGLNQLPGYFNSSFDNIFNDYILKSIQFKRVYEKIKHLPVKLK